MDFLSYLAVDKDVTRQLKINPLTHYTGRHDAKSTSKPD
jgi:hypothetical protein